MGILKASINSIGGGLADQWLEVIEPDNMGDSTVMTAGVPMPTGKRGSNKKGSPNVITDGSLIHVYPNMMMLLVDGGKIIDFTTEEGYYTVENDNAPSMFSGDFRGALDESFKRFKFGGVTPQNQKVFYINLQEIKGIKFGTPSPLNYFDNFYNAELFLRAHGNYSIKIVDPLLFYAEAIPRNKSQVDINDINEQYLSEFLTALQTSINQMSANGERISYVPSKSMELSKVMSSILDDEWRKLRGMEIVSVAVASISYTEDSMKLINMRNEGAMLGDPNVREGYMQGKIAKGLEAAGSNSGGAMNGYMGMNVGGNTSGNFFGQASAANHEQMQQQQTHQQSSQDTWECPKCHTENTGKFCSNCGEPRPQQTTGQLLMKCSDCGAVIDVSGGIPKFCPECGQPFKGMAL